jgi:hypothetical protein
MRSATTTAIRSYRIYLRDSSNALARCQDVDLPSDQDAHQIAARILSEQPLYLCAEVWDRARLVCTVRRDANRAD